MKINSNSIRKLIAIHIFLLVIFLLLWSMFGLPWDAIYIFDLFVVLECIWAAKGLQPTLRRTRLTRLLPFFAVYVLYLVLTQLLNFVSPVLAVMAFRRTFRFYLFFFAAAVLLTETGIEKMMKMLLNMQLVNFVLTLFQYFALGYSQDRLGGIFGVEKGANAYSNIFLCIVCAYILVLYLQKRTKLLPMVVILGTSLIIAALAELKMFFIELVIIVLMGILCSKPSARTVKTIIFSAIGVVIALTLLGSLFPEHLAVLMDWVLFERYTTEAISGYNISRLNAFSEINKIFFKGDFWRNLFGYGFGNCESGSAFFAKYGSYRYTWFTHQVTFLETGYVGIVLNVIFYIWILNFSTKAKKLDSHHAVYYTFGQIISALCLLWMIYDQSLRSEAAYLAFFALAVPVAIRNDRVKTQLERDRYET